MKLPTNRAFTLGVKQLAKGSRRGNPAMTGLGLVATIYGFMKSRRGPEREKVASYRLKPGRALRIAVRDTDGSTKHTDIVG